MEGIVTYSNEYNGGWEEFVSNSFESTVAHSIKWSEAIQNGLGHEPLYLLSEKGSKITGILPLFLVKTWWLSRYIVSIPWIDYGGLCADTPEIGQRLLNAGQELCQKENADFIELRSTQSSIAGLPSRSDKVTFKLDLEKGVDGIWNKFESKLKNQIRKSEKSGFSVTFGGIEYLSEFYGVFAKKMRDLGTPVWGRSFFENILKTFSKTSEIVLVKKDKATVAGGLILSFKDRLYIPSAASNPDYLKYCPNHIMYWETIKRACEQRYSSFDFGRSTINSGTYSFKKQWCPEPLPLSWQYHLNKAKETPMITPNNPKYALLRNAWRRLPLKIANVLGPLVIRNFP